MSDRISQRFVTRRARAFVEEQPGDRRDHEPLTGYAFDDVAVLCTLSDIGDPRWRLWLVQDLACRMQAGHTLKLEIVA